MGGSIWSTKDVERLGRLYPSAPWVGLLAAFPGRTKSSIQQGAQQRDLRRIKNGKWPWTGPEKEKLKKMWPRATWDELRTAFSDRTDMALAKQANALGVRRDYGQQSPYPIIRQLRQIRRAKNIKQAKLGRKVGSHAVQIAKWERGEYVPRTRTLFDWVEALGYELRLHEVL